MLTKEEVAAQGQRIYEEKIKPVVEPEQIGKFIVIDINSGDYEIGTDSISAFNQLIARQPTGERFLVRVGYPAAIKTGLMTVVSSANGRTQ